METEKDYSMYVYYKGNTNYQTKKAEFFGRYEEQFEHSYKGNETDKVEKFKEFISSLLYEQASDIYMFGTFGVDKDECYKKYIQFYFNPDLDKEQFEH